MYLLVPCYLDQLIENNILIPRLVVCKIFTSLYIMAASVNGTIKAL